MNNTELEQFRKEYETLKRENEALLEARDELRKLLETEEVKRYIELSDIVEENYEAPSDESLATKVYSNISYSKIKEENSNNILIYMGSYLFEKLTYDSDPDADYKAYMDLETMRAYNIPLENVKTFENAHTIIYIPVTYPNHQEFSRNFFALRNWFLLEILRRPQADVINTITTLKELKFIDSYITEKRYSDIHLKSNKYALMSETQLNEHVRKIALKKEE